MKLIKLKNWLDLRKIDYTFQPGFEYGGAGLLWPKEELKFEFDDKEWIVTYEPEWTRERVALQNPPNTQIWIFKKPAMIVEYLEHREKIDYELKLAYEVIKTSCKEKGGAWPEGGFTENHGTLVGRGWELVLEPCRTMLWRPADEVAEPGNWNWIWGVSDGCPAQTMIEEVLKKIGQLEDEYWERG